MSLADLQRVVDESHARAGEFVRRLFSNPKDAETVQAHLQADGDFTVATISRNGRPHAALTIGTCVDGVIYFTSTDGSLLSRNLAYRPEVAFTCGGVMAAGRARPVCKCGTLPEDLDAALLELCGKVIAPGFDGTLWAIGLRRLIL